MPQQDKRRRRVPGTGARSHKRDAKLAQLLGAHVGLERLARRVRQENALDIRADRRNTEQGGAR